MKKISRNEGLLILGQWTSKIGDIVFDYVNSIAIVSTSKGLVVDREARKMGLGGEVICYVW